MRCPPHDLDLTPQTEPQRLALEELRRHAQGCQRCAGWLRGMQRVDEALASALGEEGQGEADDARGCPPAEQLLAGLAGGLSDRLVEHLTACAACRADLLVAADASRSSGRLRRPSSRRAQLAATDCPRGQVELHPQTEAERRALEELRRHARGCASCAGWLERARRADDLLRAVLREAEPVGACPPPERLVGALEGGLADEPLVLHLNGCADCRADLLAAASAGAVRPASARLAVQRPADAAASPRAGRLIRFTPPVLAAAAAVLLTVGGAVLLLAPAEGPQGGVAQGSGSTREGSEPERPGQDGGSPGSLTQEGPAPTRDPSRLSDPAGSDPFAPSGGAQGHEGRDAEGPQLASDRPDGAESPLERGLLPDQPAEREVPAVVGVPGEGGQAPVALETAGELELLAASGVDALAPGESRWRAAAPGPLAPGTRLRAAGSKGALRLAEANLYLDRDAQLVAGHKALAVQAGQVYYETAPGAKQGLALEHPLGKLEVAGQGLVHARAGELAVASVDGTVRAADAHGQVATVMPGERVDVSPHGNGSPQPITPGNPKPPGPPSWVQDMQSQMGPPGQGNQGNGNGNQGNGNQGNQGNGNQGNQGNGNQGNQGNGNQGQGQGQGQGKKP